MKKRNPKIGNYSTAYWAMRPFWTDCLNLKEPVTSGSTVSGLATYLNRYAKEDDDEFGQRIKRLAQVNFLDIIIDAYTSMLFSTDVRISSTKFQDEVNRFVARCNQRGDSLMEYFREVIAPSALAYGVLDVFCDKPAPTAEAVTKADVIAQKLDQVYCYCVPPLKRTNWELDDAGNYTMYRSIDVINTQIATQMGIRDSKQYMEWDLESVTEYTKGGTEIDSRPNPYGFIPAVTVIPLPSIRYYDDRMGLSLVQDAVPLQKLILNLISLILDFHESVNFGMRVLIQDTGENGDELEPPTQGELAEGGNKRGIIVKGKGSRYEIVTPDAAGVEAMNRFLNDMIERVFQSVRISSDSNMNKTHQSRGTIRGNMAPLYNRMTRISKHFGKATRQIIETALRVQGIDPVEANVTVSWGTNFSFESFLSAIEELTAFRNVAQDLSPTAVAEIARKAVGSQIYDTDKIETVNKEIDKWVKSAVENPQPLGPQGKKGKPKGTVPVSNDLGTLPSVQKQNTEFNAVAKAEE